MSRLPSVSGLSFSNDRAKITFAIARFTSCADPLLIAHPMHPDPDPPANSGAALPDLRRPRTAGPVVLPLFAATVLLSAFLLFVVQPFAGRLLLPELGGVPSAWTACLLFFQAVLLFGYGWGHALSLIPKRTARVGLHVALIATAALVLPPTPPSLDPQLATDSPTLFALLFLGRTVGLPFFALATTAPILQSWFAGTDHPAAQRPYMLYAASNAGSLGSLLAYPFVVEPLLGLSEQGRAFGIGFLCLLALVVLAAITTLRAPERAVAIASPIALARPNHALRMRWLLYAMVPSALLATVSSYLSMDLAPVPLLWILPLAAYLATFIVAFAKSDTDLPLWMSRVARLLAAALVVATGVHANSPLTLLVGLHLTFFVLVTLVIHRRLARLAPLPAHLTEFYFFMALGGVLGTLVAGVLPTMLLPDTWEHAIAIAVACGLTLAPSPTEAPLAREAPASEGATPSEGSPTGDAPKPEAPPTLRADLSRAGILLALSLAFAFGLPFLGLGTFSLAPLLVFGVPIIAAYRESLNPRRYTLCLLAIILAGTTYSERGTELLRRERDFFGVLRVVNDGPERVLLHGTTLHGSQRLDQRALCEPLAYYRREGPLGRAIAARRAAFPIDPAHPITVSAIGLGAGSIACYAEPGERWTFHEISAAVVDIASDASLFTYLSNARGEIELRVDDGRVGLEATPEHSRAMVLVDAFNSDAVPVHLLTREAIALYMRALEENGWLLLHVSNRSLDLVRIVGPIADAEHLAARVNRDASEVGGSGEAPSWIVMGRDEAALAGLPATEWTELPPSSRAAWTDERSSLVQALR